MKTWRVLQIRPYFGLVGLVRAETRATIPKFDTSTEAVCKGAVDDVHERPGPASGGLGSHLILKQPDCSPIEGHFALTKLVTQYELVFHEGDVVEATGVKVKFEGVDTIFTRKIKLDDDLLFRDNSGSRSRSGFGETDSRQNRTGTSSFVTRAKT